MSLSKLFSEDFGSLSSLQKILFFILLPVGVVFLIWKLKNSLTSISEDKKRTDVDIKSADLDNKINDLKTKEINITKSIETTEKEKEDAIIKANSDDSISFHNNRKSDS